MKTIFTKPVSGDKWKTVLLLVLMAILVLLMAGIWYWYDRQISQLNKKAAISGILAPDLSANTMMPSSLNNENNQILL